MAMSVAEAARELREVVEKALDNGLVDLLIHPTPGRRDEFRSALGHAKTINEWVALFVSKETDLKDALRKPQFITKKGLLKKTHKYVDEQAAAGVTFQNACINLFTELVDQQAKEISDIFQKSYEREYGRLNRGSDFLEDLDHNVEILWAAVRGNDKAAAERAFNYILWMLNVKYFGHSRNSSQPGSGLGLLAESIQRAFHFLGFDVSINPPNIVLSNFGSGWNYLSQNMGRAAYPDTTHKDPNEKRGTTYFYAWWLFDSIEDYNIVAQSERWPRNREEDRPNYREPGRKKSNIEELLSANKGTGKVYGLFLGARDMVDRNQPFTDEVPLPELLPGQVIALGAARAKLFDIATKEFRMGSFLHSVPRYAGMGVGDLTREWIREGKRRFDSTNLIWHWTRWTGALPIEKSEIKGRIVCEPKVKALGLNLPCNDDAEATAMMSNPQPIGLNHVAEIEILDAAGNVKTVEKVNADAEGRFSASIPTNAPFRVNSPALKPFGKGVHTNGWQKSKTMIVKPGTKIENIIVPKKEGGDDPDIVTDVKELKVKYHYTAAKDKISVDDPTEVDTMKPPLPAEVILYIPEKFEFVVEPGDFFCFLDAAGNPIPGSRVEGDRLEKCIEKPDRLCQIRMHFDGKQDPIMPTLPPEARQVGFKLHKKKHKTR